MTETPPAMPPRASASVRAARGSNLDTVRQHNLGTLLRLVHGTSGRSRSELTRATGLSRSTIGALVAELVALGLVTETDPREPTGVGRPSPIVRARADVVAVTVNPDVDGVELAVLGLDGTLHRRMHHVTEVPPTAAEAARIAAVLLDGLRPVLGRMRVAGLGAAVPGSVRAADGVVRLAPHLEWVDEPFAALLREATGLSVRVANDANLGAAAEHLFGAGRGIEDLVYLNGGPGGIGGGVITGGVPLAGSAGYAGELGHTLVNTVGARCHCGAIGCLETEVSQARLLDAFGVDDAERLRRALTDVASHTPASRREVERQLRFLAVGIRNAVNTLGPRRVVLGGFLGALRDVAPELLDAEVREQALAVTAEHLDIVHSELGPAVLTVGAAELAFGGLLENPAALHASVPT